MDVHLRLPRGLRSFHVLNALARRSVLRSSGALLEDAAGVMLALRVGLFGR